MPRVVIRTESCKNCRYCVVFCPGKVLETGTEANEKGYPFVQVKNPESCTGCAVCALMCPDAAIEVYR